MMVVILQALTLMTHSYSSYALAADAVSFTCARGLVVVENINPQSGVLVIQDFARGMTKTELVACEGCSTTGAPAFSYARGDGSYGILVFDSNIFSGEVEEFQVDMNGRRWACSKN